MAGLNDNDPVRSFLENLTECVMCFDEMDQPKFLQCGHSFCQECLRKQFKAATKDQVNVSNILCALCRNPTNIPRTGLESLPSSFVIEDAKGCLKIANNLGLTKNRLLICGKSGHNKVLDMWCEKSMELICIACCAQQLHLDHSLHHVTIIEACQKYRKNKYEFEKKISELVSDIDSLKKEIDVKREEKNKIVETARQDRKEHTMVVESYQQQLENVRAEKDKLEHKFQTQIESLVDENECLEKENNKSTIRAIRQRKIIKMKHKTELDLVEETKSLKEEKNKIVEIARQDRKEHTMVVESYQQQLENVRAEKDKLEHKFQTQIESLVYENECLEKEKNKSTKRAIRQRKLVKMKYKTELNEMQSKDRDEQIHITALNNELISLKLEKSKNMKHVKIMKRNHQALLFFLTILCLYCLYKLELFKFLVFITLFMITIYNYYYVGYIN
ncbi:uncharacterized protein [Antedon mediterranea]|uniref:uncharacterized protein n=1 Tax=Antedon mediterranea TaxID=105859 RepID=UPI003AF51623